MAQPRGGGKSLQQAYRPNMSVIEALSEEEMYLACILQDLSGIDILEFIREDEQNDHGRWRAWPFQWSWLRCQDPLQLSACGRSVGKTLSIQARSWAFMFNFPGQEMVIVGPQLVHLEPLSSAIESSLYEYRITRDFIVEGRSGVTHRPFQLNFKHGGRIIGRLPQSDGKGLKGCLHENTPILTSDGIKMVQDVGPGDEVLSHSGKWVKVLQNVRDVNDSYEVRGQGSMPMVVSCDHRFYGAENLSDEKHARSFSHMAWHDTELLLEHQVYWATPTEFPQLPVPDLEYQGTAKRLATDTKEFWWLVGRYLADGYLSMNKNNGKERRVCWIVDQHKVDSVAERIRAVGGHVHVQHRDHSSAPQITLASAPLHRWLLEHFGQHADGKTMPGWLFGMEEPYRQAVLDGYLAGDGYWSEDRQRWQCSTASKRLAVGLQLLAQSLGYSVNAGIIQPKPNGMTANPKPAHTLQIKKNGIAVKFENYLLGKVKQVTPVGKQPVYRVYVDHDDHSYLSGTIMSHNIHPLWLESDEYQDMTKDAHVELIETLKRGVEGAVWRAHGVSRGLRDHFWEMSQPYHDNPWTVHQYTGVHRPNWSPEERASKITIYGGSEEDEDFRRNVYGVHGNATHVLFPAGKLMSRVDDEESSPYNLEEFFSIELKDTMIEGDDILNFIDLNRAHLSDYKVFWIGQDVGLVNHPSEILVFGEFTPTKKDDYRIPGKMRPSVVPDRSVLKLLVRIHLLRIGYPDQARVLMHLIDFYNPRAYSLDKTGMGQPIYEDIQHRMGKKLDIIHGYGFSEKILVDFDQSLHVDPDHGDLEKDSGMKRNVLEYSTDVLRSLMDEGRIILPYDKKLLNEFMGQTFTYTKSTVDAYGKKRRFSQGSYHILDAARMAVLGWKQTPIEQFVKEKDNREPVADIFVSF